MPPIRLKLVLPGGSCLQRIGATWDEFEGLDTDKLLLGIVTVSSLIGRMAGSTMDTQDGSSCESSETESSNVQEESSSGLDNGSGWIANTVMSEENSSPSESGELHEEE